ncbi:MAG: InlB B-repeat-containing protein, partial [Clostridia bacterium]|nr:InlB B-repeat-containing protein [Clostridia bacterium]
MKALKSTLSVLLALCLILAMAPATASATEKEPEIARGVQNSIIIDTDPTGGYEGDYVVIYNPATSSGTSYSTGTMTGLIETSVTPNILPNPSGSKAQDAELPFYKIDVDSKLKKLAETMEPEAEPEPTRASYSVGETKTFRILQSYSPTGSSSVSFECLYVGQHCYIWTPVSSSNNTYPLDEIDSTYAKLAADEFDSKFDLMQSSFGNHTNGSSGDGKLHMLYYNINDGWQPGQGYVAGFFYQVDITNNGLPILNIDTYPGVYYKNSAGTEYKRMDDTYNTMVHEYQHLINYSNTSGMSTWLNECFSAAAEEICYPGSSVVGRIQSWEEYYYSDNNDWLNPPKEFMYDSANSLHTGFSMYNWDNNLDNNAILALYSQVSFFAQYLFTRFGNTIYKQISNKYSSNDTSAITSATGVSCADLVRDFRVAVTANASQNQYNGIYGFKVQNGYDPTQYNNVANPWSLLGPVIFTGTSCSIKGGGAITVKPVNGVYNPPSGANSNLKYIGIKLASVYTVTAVSNNEAWGTVSVDGIKITASPATGYYVSGYEVVSGTATATINGNTITVAPESDCTIRVIFAPKPSYTVSFVASGSSEGSETAFDGDAITLPSSVSVNADGWTFSGWTDEQVPEETTQNPGYLLPGASYTVTGNATLYALYTRVDEGAGEVGYELVSNAPTDWTGNYVITYGTDTSMYVMTGVTPSSNGAQIESASNATTYANAGVSLSGSVLSNVANSYIFKLAKHGNYYSIQSASTNAYIGEDSSSYLAGYTTYASGSCDWTPGTLDNASSATNANNGSYPLLGFSTGSGYFWSGSISSGTSAAKNVRFWRENGGDLTYYTTEPVEAGPAFTTQSLLLEGKIGVRFYVRLPEALRNENTSVSFTISGKGGDACTATVPFSSDLPTNTNGYYGFTYYVGVIQMADTIT